MGYPFLQSFLALTEAYYGVTITPLDYGDPEAARLTINAWVEENTHGKIKNPIRTGLLDPMTTLVLVNAIYFKGNWAEQFDPQRTSPAPFWRAPGDKVEVPMPQPVFRADHPFLFLLRDRRTGGILFLGRVADPA